MKPKQKVVERAISNGCIDRVNRLLSGTHILFCEANNLIEEASDELKKNGLLMGSLKKFHSDFVHAADRYFFEFSLMVDKDKKMDMFSDMDEFDSIFREWMNKNNNSNIKDNQ